MATQSSNSGDGRVFFRDIKPYAIVDDLDQLRGPAGGVVKLSHSVLWAPGHASVDLDEPGGRGLAYRAVLAEGTVEDLVQILNRKQLIAVWAELLLIVGCVRRGRPGSPSCSPPNPSRRSYRQVAPAKDPSPNNPV